MRRRQQIFLIAWVGIVTLVSPLPAHASDNTVLGTGAGASLGSDAHDNTVLGQGAGAVITTGDANTLVGASAGQDATTGSYNTMVGQGSGYFSTTGSYNTTFGLAAGQRNGAGSGNTYLGRDAGKQSGGRAGNVFVGKGAGGEAIQSDSLYLDIFETHTPLIYGEFDNDVVGINGALGVGTQIPMDQLHVYNGNLRIEQAGATHAILNFVSNGHTWEIKNNEATGRLTFFSPGGGATTASFKFDRQATENLLRVGILNALTVDINGNLVVTGDITNPDDVFSPEYPLETIEAHTAYMWMHQHLPAVGPGQVNAQGQAMVNVGARSQGILEELEKAHIYIDQLHKEISQNQAQLDHAQRTLDQLKGDGIHKGQRMAALTRAVTAHEVKLVALKSKMIEKESQEKALKDKVTTLKAVVHHLIRQNRATGPGKEG